MKKCVLCLKDKARRECHLKEGVKICSRCCAELRGEHCSDCSHYAETLRHQAERWREGSLPEGHFIAELNPEVQDAVYEALALGMDGEISEAMPIMKRLVRDYPRCYDVHYGMGLLHGFQGQREKSIECFLRCLKIFPYFAEAYYNLAVSYSQSYRITDAITAYRKAVKYGEPAEEYYVEAKSAIENAAQVILENNGVDLDTYLESSAMFDKAFACMEAGDWEDALAGFLVCAKLVPNGLSTYGNLTLCYTNLGRKADALAAFDRALEIDPAYEPALNNRVLAERMEEGVPLAGIGFESINYGVEKIKRRKRKLFSRK